MKTTDQKALAEKLKNKLQEGIVTFSYRKTNGEDRVATGTTKMSLVPEDKRPQNNNANEYSSGMTQKYFDIEKNAWRSLRKDNLVVVLRYTDLSNSDSA